MGPPGPQGQQGLQGATGSTGINGSQGPPGRPGAGNLTLCQYKNKKEAAQTAGISADAVVVLREDEHPVCVS